MKDIVDKSNNKMSHHCNKYFYYVNAASNEIEECIHWHCLSPNISYIYLDQFSCKVLMETYLSERTVFANIKM